MSLFAETVPKALYDDAVADRRRSEERLAALVADSVPRSAFDALTAHLATVTKEAMAIKRHETGMIPADFDASLSDPMRSLGAHTQMAIEERAAGDPSDRKYLINRAHLELAMLRSQVSDEDEADRQLAAMILEGDTA